MADGGTRSDVDSGWRILRGDGDGRVDHLPGSGMSGGLMRQPQQQGGHHFRARAACCGPARWWHRPPHRSSPWTPPTCVYTHVRAGDYSPQFGLAIGFLLPAVATLGLGLPSALKSV
jgi:hypothetical protein